MKRSLRRLLAILLVLIMLSADICTIAESAATLFLPSALQVIDEEAFYGNTSIVKIIVPYGTTEIRSKAFADSSLTELELPDTLTFIAEDAFEGCGEFVLTVPENCYAYDRCVELGLIKVDEPDPSVIESAHPYPDEFDYTWIYDSGEGTESVTITFSADTETEEDYDFIYIYTLNDVQVGKYSGTELAGQSVTIDGTGFKLRLTSDEAWGGGNTYHGFKLDSIVPKKAIPLTFDSITAESSAVNAGETIRWTVATTGGKAPVYYDYTVLLGEEEVATGTVEAPNAIEYAPVRADEYKLSVIARDSADVVLPAQMSEAVTVAPSTAYPESAHPYAANMDQSWVYAAEENVESLTVTFSEETKTQSNYDYIYIYDQYGEQVGKYSGTQLAGQAIEILGSAFTIRLTSNGSTQYNGFTITNIEKYIPGPLTFVSLTVDKAKAKTGELITWMMETEGGRRPVTYEYTVTLNGETIYTGSVTRPEQISYAPMIAGDYTMSVVAKDAKGNELPAQTSGIRITQREATPEEYFTYEAINGLYARITGYSGTDEHVVVPEMVGEYIVQEIGADVFRDNATLVSVALPDTVTVIGASAFRSCTSLSGIDLGDGVTTVKNYAFYNCDSLRTFSFPDSVTTTGYAVLRYCDNLTSVHFPIGWTSADSSGYIVANCPKLECVALPEGLINVPSYALANNPNLKEIILPEGLENINLNAFAECTGLTGMVFPSTIKTVGGLKGCTCIGQIVIPEGTETIGPNAFISVPLESITIPDSVTQINNYAFQNCVKLETVQFGNGLITIGSYAFSGCKALLSANLPDTVTTILERAFKNCERMTEFHYPQKWNRAYANNNSIYGDNGYIFEGCKSLKRIDVPEGITGIPKHAFHGASYLTDITLPTTLVSIGAYAFSNCEGIANMQFPTGLQTVGAYAFSDCINLKAANLPDTVTTILERAFKNCKKMTEFHYPLMWNRAYENSLSIYGDDGYIFEGCESLNTIEVPEGVTIIPKYAFNGAKYLVNVTLPSTLISIGEYAFGSCTSITKLYIPTNVTSIAQNAFKSCSNLKIYCEYGSYALQYAINNSIPYFYLSLTGASLPTGTLYRGDSFSLYGYVRSSEAITSITGTIYASDGAVLQEVSITPEVTDYDLSGTYNASLKFGELELGDYVYELVSTAGEETETLALSSFTIAPPPLRIYISRGSFPNGILRVSGDVQISGSVISNYAITQVQAILSNAETGASVRSYVAYPGAYQFDISAANAQLSLSTLSDGAYTLTIAAVSNGESRVLYSADFQTTSYDGLLDDDTIQALIDYVSDDSNRDIFTTKFVEEAIDDLSWVEYGIVVFDYALNTSKLELLEDALIRSGQSKELIELYKKEIVSLIDSGAYDQVNYIEDLDDYTKNIVESLKTAGKITKEVITDEYMQGTIEAFNDLMKDFSTVVGVLGDMETAYETIASVCANIENGLMILDYIGENAEVAKQEEFQTALAILKEEYVSAANAKIIETGTIVMNAVIKEGEELVEKLVEKLTESITSGAYKVEKLLQDLIVKLLMSATGLDEVASSLKKFFVQYHLLEVALEGYYNAFDTVKDGDHSTSAMNRLSVAFNVTRSAWIRTHDTICQIELFAYTVGNEALDYMCSEKFRNLSFPLPVKEDGA